MIALFNIVIDGRFLSGRLMQSNPVVILLVVLQLSVSVDTGHHQRPLVARIEFVSEGAVHAFDAAVVFWAFRWQYMQRNVEFFTGLFKLGHKFTASIDPHRFNDKRCLVTHIFEKAPSATRGDLRAVAHPAHLGDQTHRIELLDVEYGVDLYAHVVDLDHLTEPSDFQIVVPAFRMTVERAGLCVPHTPLVERYGLDEPAPDGGFTVLLVVIPTQHRVQFPTTDAQLAI